MPSYDTDEKRWRAVQARDHRADLVFLYGVVTTGIFCYPSCPSRAAQKKNMRFFNTQSAAMEAGMRACKRCRSDQAPLRERQQQMVENACRLIEHATAPIKIDTVAAKLCISRFHLQKLFRQFLDVSPKEYAKAVRAKQLGHALSGSSSVTHAVYNAGYDSASAFYAEGASRLGMKAKDYQSRGKGLHIRYAFGKTAIGKIVVAATDKGVCSILFGDNQQALVSDLESRFSQAVLTRDSGNLSALVNKVVSLINNPRLVSDLPLDIQGTAFQEKVWTALRKIPPGDTASYSDIAREIGNPTAARSVAQACSANPAAVIVPCHRVIRANGETSGYRWGVERKRELLNLENPED